MRTNQHVYGERAFWVKGVEADMVMGRLLTVLLREGDRSDPQTAPHQWLPLFTPIPIYCITRPGDQSKGIVAVFEQDQGITVQIVRRTVTRLQDIIDSDLCFGVGTAVPVVAGEVVRYLSEELSPGKSFAPDTVMTVYWVEYLPSEVPALD